MTGTVKRLLKDKGFGFIEAQDGNEYFFHRSGVASGNFDQFKEGITEVSFDVERSPKGPRACNVQVT